MQSHLPIRPVPLPDDTLSPPPEAGKPQAEEPQAEEIQAEANPPDPIETDWNRRGVEMVGVLTVWMRWGVGTAALLTIISVLGLLILYVKLDDIRESNAATTSVVLNTAMLNDRAWIEPVEIDCPLALNSPISITTKAVNHGRTVANACVIIVGMQNLKYPALPDTSVLDSTTDAKFTSSLVTAPGQQITFDSVPISPTLAKDSFDGIQSGKTRVFTLGKIRYQDIFKKHHWVRFCYVYDPKTSQWINFENNVTDDE
jgi:hypothetical protein